MTKEQKEAIAVLQGYIRSDDYMTIMRNRIKREKERNATLIESQWVNGSWKQWHIN